MSKRVKKQEVNSLYHYEILDRCHIVNCIINDHLINHPAISKAMQKKLEKAQGLIGDVYQWAGSKS